MRRWVVEVRDSQGALIGRNDALYLHPYASKSEAEDWAYARWPKAAKVRAWRWRDDRDDWEKLSPGE